MKKLDVIFKESNIEIRERRSGGIIVGVPYQYDDGFGISNFKKFLYALGFDVEVSDERVL